MRRLTTDGSTATDSAADTCAPFPAFERIPGARTCGLILLCDHAANALPPGYGSLGLPKAELERHIGYDIGAAGVTRMLAHRLGCPAVLTRYSRLLIDPNRGEDDPTLVMRLSDGAVVPGNRHVDEAEIERRLARFHRPYHDAIDDEIEAALAQGVVPVLLSLHSFTPVWRGLAQPWHAAVLWDSDPRFTRELIDALEAPGDLIVGDNEPYDGALRGDCLYRHATLRGLANTLLEIRQDLIAEVEGQRAWADRLAGLLPEILARPELHEMRAYGSRTGPIPPI
ncbi:N-formylglutamate amidohydrolase [Ancylobacter dichloromethanicus]|uniref:N-formylglutamate amidohydrolase n=1 Tax=Ancylobacter dichloromethanicus TaxID=518825 RepID=A0A9W6MXC6_9HYPH|nr:N-formylglutamate amidohydrolase [Ancylobacter dichloromethanicus]MBS7555253.1 N-formylglutamate amidohydrolase [Ancylobacter dichloromethanicus]GLK70434.1 N-formylglutamate amidohydrolase [Ancylobacter dichloromethanicus]